MWPPVFVIGLVVAVVAHGDDPRRDRVVSAFTRRLVQRIDADDVNGVWMMLVESMPLGNFGVEDRLHLEVGAGPGRPLMSILEYAIGHASPAMIRALVHVGVPIRVRTAVLLAARQAGRDFVFDIVGPYIQPAGGADVDVPGQERSMALPAPDTDSAVRWPTTSQTVFAVVAFVVLAYQLFSRRVRMRFRAIRRNEAPFPDPVPAAVLPPATPSVSKRRKRRKKGKAPGSRTASSVLEVCAEQPRVPALTRVPSQALEQSPIETANVAQDAPEEVPAVPEHNVTCAPVPSPETSKDASADERSVTAMPMAPTSSNYTIAPTQSSPVEADSRAPNTTAEAQPDTSSLDVDTVLNALEFTLYHETDPHVLRRAQQRLRRIYDLYFIPDDFYSDTRRALAHRALDLAGEGMY
ncbi:Uncharacterized protein PBTT_01692 [Plasmodiophora brassicae]|uniref:Uncharacterized protein n=1 Tax=Plasmodiophora brassicae TaxID=37360 RepID=A0A0G4IST7_PLABS|nr:hypothetical protein PBRA_006444 [Plasmodiophora brassicae]SPQ94415.1 unnamed protein product [Plasmodiophora brassicae]